ncbi:MAG: Holliday junction branch migration protein RuvA [Candidatus Omnitrophica bacterium]|nr:Holliday junction branch migration protein RuvA [Candidatus Omnitrophota bacterium]MCM8830903.1 Holliday junction branch migration protein RuvA [Candidatus Omnitrophota bacterium]
MISKIKGRLVEKKENYLLIDVGGLYYEVDIPKTVYLNLSSEVNEDVELVIYHYLSMDKSKAIPVMIGFCNELEKDFFEKFISVSGIGPKGALKAFDKPIPQIAQAIEEGDIDFLTTLEGIGKQKAKQIVAYLQGKVGRFALIKSPQVSLKPPKKEILEEAKQILKKLQYQAKEIDDMIKKAVDAKPTISSVEELLNEIYRQRK